MSTCICGKRRHASRKDAKRAIRAMKGREPSPNHLSAYRCDHEPNTWHIGHIPTVVLKGDLPRSSLVSKARGDHA